MPPSGKRPLEKNDPKSTRADMSPDPPGLVYTQRTVVLFRLDGLQLPEGGAAGGQRPRFFQISVLYKKVLEKVILASFSFYVCLK